MLTETAETLFEALGFLETSIRNATPQEVVIWGIHILLALIVIQCLYLIVILFTNKYLSFKSKTFSVDRSGAEKRILVLGDSTAVGTGADKPGDSLAGKLAHDFPHTEIVNLGEDGTLTRDALAQIKEVSDQEFDMVFISTGGNDIWHFTKLKSLENDLRELLRIAKRISNHRVILLLYSNISIAPIFPFFVQWFLIPRTRSIQEVFRQTAYEEEVPCIELFTKETDNLFAQNRKKYFAADNIHPSSQGYHRWYARMWRKMAEEGHHFSERNQY